MRLKDFSVLLLFKNAKNVNGSKNIMLFNRPNFLGPPNNVKCLHLGSHFLHALATLSATMCAEFRSQCEGQV